MKLGVDLAFLQLVVDELGAILRKESRLARNWGSYRAFTSSRVFSLRRLMTVSPCCRLKVPVIAITTAVL